MKGTFTSKKKIFTAIGARLGVSPLDVAPDEGFTLALTLQEIPEEVKRLTLVKVPFLRVEFVRADVRDPKALTPCEAQDHLWRFGDVVDLIEATVTFQSATMGRRDMAVDLVCALVDFTRPVYLYYDGVRLAWIQDEVINCDMPFGKVVSEGDDVLVSDCATVRFGGRGALTASEVEVSKKKNLAYFVPDGYNVWAGDTSGFFHEGTYHLMYLIDRHHHKSRWEGGAHAVMHVTTRDLVNWTETELLTLDEQWKTAGTGTMLFHSGRYYYVHGWHTSRFVPEEETGTQIFIERGHEHVNQPITYDEIKERGFLPCGANFMTSTDGLNFTRECYQFHVAENPCVYAKEDGSLVMMAGYGSDGEWTADSITSKWTKKEGFSMTASVMKPSTECPFLLEANGFRYLIAGRSGFWMAKMGEPWQDVAKDGVDLYDGLFVPCPVKSEDGRLILSGWLPCGGEWAYMIVHRELLQRPDGRLDECWLRELAPQKDELTPLCGEMQRGKSYYAEFDLSVEKGGVARITFDGDERVELTLDEADERIQIATVKEGKAHADRLLTLAEQMPDLSATSEAKDCHLTAHDFAIGRADGLRGAYMVRAVIYVEPKLNATVIDCEIGGRRTIISQRGQVWYGSVSADVEGGKVNATRIYELNA